MDVLISKKDLPCNVRSPTPKMAKMHAAQVEEEIFFPIRPLIKGTTTTVNAHMKADLDA